MILARGGWELADRVIPHQAERDVIKWRKAAAEPVLVGSLRGANPAEHLDSIRQNQTYYIKLSNNQPRQFAACAVALYFPMALRKPGAVEYYAEVHGIDVVPRSAIPTPWVTKRKKDELVVVYHLSKFQKTRRPILNIGESEKIIGLGANGGHLVLHLSALAYFKSLCLRQNPSGV